MYICRDGGSASDRQSGRSYRLVLKKKQKTKQIKCKEKDTERVIINLLYSMLWSQIRCYVFVIVVFFSSSSKVSALVRRKMIYTCGSAKIAITVYIPFPWMYVK